MIPDNETDQQRNERALNYVGEAIFTILHEENTVDYVTSSLADLASSDPQYSHLADVAQEVQNKVQWLEDEIKRMLGGEITDSMRQALERYHALDLYEEFLDYDGDRLMALGEEYGHHTAWLLGRILYLIREAEEPDPAALVVNDEVVGKLWRACGYWYSGFDLDFIDAYIETVPHIKLGYEHEAEWSMAEQLEEPSDDTQIDRAMFGAAGQVAIDMMSDMLGRLGRGPGRNWREDSLRFTRLALLHRKAVSGLERRRPGTPSDPSALEDYRAWIDQTREFHAELTKDEPHGDDG